MITAKFTRVRSRVLSLASFFIVALFTILSMSSFAQTKLAHVDSLTVMEYLAEKNNIEFQMEAEDKILKDKYANMEKLLKSTIEKFKTAADADKAELKQDGERLQQALQTFLKNVPSFLKAKREALYEPLIKEAKVVIADIAKEREIDYVVDAQENGGVVLYRGGEDLTDMVLERLKLAKK